MSWTHLQAISTVGSGASGAAQFASNVVSGSKIIVLVSCTGASSVTASTVKDGAGNNWTKITSVQNTGGANFLEISLWALDTPAGDVGIRPIITVTPSTSVNNGIGITIQEVSGLNPGNTVAAMIDGTAGAGTGVGSPTSAPSYSSTAVNEYLVNGLVDWGDSSTWSITGYTATDGTNTSGLTDNLLAYKNSTGGAESGNWTGGAATTQWAQILAAFKLAAVSLQPAMVTYAYSSN